MNDLRIYFSILRKDWMKLNPKKYAFMVKSDRFLGYLVTERENVANQDKIRALVNASPKTKKEVKWLTGRILALNRFISRWTDKCKPFFKLLNRVVNFERNESCKQVFQQLKTYITDPLLLVQPDQVEELFLCLRICNKCMPKMTTELIS